MKDDFGVPLEGGPSDSFTRERASASPAENTPRKTRITRARTTPRAVTAPLPVALGPLQRWFAAAVTHPASAADGIEQGLLMGEIPVGVDDLERLVRPSSRLSALERIEIYHHAYRARLVECLVDDYPAVEHALGAEDFASLCHRYMTAYPSTSPSLNFFGRHVATFCRTWDDPRRDFAGELAMLEWSMVEVLHAAPAENLSLQALAAIPLSAWASARFTPSATVRLFEFVYPVNAYYQAFRQEEAPALPAPSWSATAIFRDMATIWRMDLNRPMYKLLRSLLEGASLGDALDALVNSGDVGEEQAPAVMGWFRDWVRHGLFSAIEVSQHDAKD